jgi:hypothetical protein
VPLNGTGGRATLTFGERAAGHANAKGDHGGKNHGLHRSSPEFRPVAAGSWVLLDRWGLAPVCDAQEMDLIYRKYNPD